MNQHDEKRLNSHDFFNKYIKPIKHDNLGYHLGFLKTETQINPIICLNEDETDELLNWYNMLDLQTTICKTNQTIPNLKNTFGLIQSIPNIKIEIPKVYQTHVKVKQPSYDISCRIVNPSKYSHNLFGSVFDSKPKLVEYDNNKDDNNKDDNNENITIILHVDTLQTLVLPILSTHGKYILNNRFEFGFIKVCTITNQNSKVVQELSTLFHKKEFFSIDELQEELIESVKITNKYNNFIDPNKESMEVRKALTIMFTKTNSLTNRMKANDIYNHLESNYKNTIQCKSSGFKNRLAIYLKNWGLKKKRYNDGNYYYGLILKSSTVQSVKYDQLNSFGNPKMVDCP
jgi:hypothetical protein